MRWHSRLQLLMQVTPNQYSDATGWVTPLKNYKSTDCQWGDATRYRGKQKHQTGGFAATR